MATYGIQWRTISDLLGGAPLTSNHLAWLTELRGVVPGGSRSRVGTVGVPSRKNQHISPREKRAYPKKEGSRPTIPFSGWNCEFLGGSKICWKQLKTILNSEEFHKKQSFRGVSSPHKIGSSQNYSPVFGIIFCVSIWWMVPRCGKMHAVYTCNL